MADNESKTIPIAAPTTALPPLPAGFPNTFQLGIFRHVGQDDYPAATPWGFSYEYLTGGVGTGYPPGLDWSEYEDPPGEYATHYLQQCAAMQPAVIPGFVYYELLPSGPRGNAEWDNLQSAPTMYAIYNNFQLLMQKCALHSGPVVVIIEPDTDGVLQELFQGQEDNAHLQHAHVASSGHPDLAGMENTVAGFYQAFCRLRNLYAPNVLLCQDISLWGPDMDLIIALRRAWAENPHRVFDWQFHAHRTARYHNTFTDNWTERGYDLNAFSPSDRDAGWYMVHQESDRWWHDDPIVQPNFGTVLGWIKQIGQETGRRFIFWQFPNGNNIYRSCNDTEGHYQDNKVQYFLGSRSGRLRLLPWIKAGAVGLMFGAGSGDSTHYWDAAADGVTNPPPENTNNQLARVTDDDGGYIREQSAYYYQLGALPLPPR